MPGQLLAQRRQPAHQFLAQLPKQQRIISSTLDPIYVQRKAVQVYRTLAESPNKTVIMLPNSTKGTGLPLVLTEGKRKLLSAADEELLAAMEERYMAIAGNSVEDETSAEDSPPKPDSTKATPTPSPETETAPSTPSQTETAPTAPPAAGVE